MKKRAQAEKSLFMLIGIVLAAVMIIILIGFFNKIGSDDDKDYTQGIGLLHLKLKYYEDNMGKLKEDEVQFSMSKNNIIVFFNNDINPNEEIIFDCKYNYVEEYTALTLKGWKEGDDFKSEDITIETKKPVECQKKSCMCLAKLDAASWNEFRDKNKWIMDVEDSMTNCFFYDKLEFKNTDKDTFYCGDKGISFINSHIEDDKELPFYVNTYYEGEFVTVRSPLKADNNGKVSVRDNVRDQDSIKK